MDLLSMVPPHFRKMGCFKKERSDRARYALSEDLVCGDITSDSVLRDDSVVEGKIICCERCVVAGLQEAVAVIGKNNCTVGVIEGGVLKRGTGVIHIRMEVRDLLKRIRTALNYLSYLSGLATNARRLEKRFGVKRVAALRKTHPGLGLSEKHALQIGGVMAHRVNLGDSILIKKEHIAIVGKETGFSRSKVIEECITRARTYIVRRGVGARGVFIGIEVESLVGARAAAGTSVDVIMLDNVGRKRVKSLVKEIRSINQNVVIEASGGLREAGVGGFLDCGVDVVSGSCVFDAEPIDFTFVLGV
ncbi:MAG: hypothetical protein ABIG39_03630 [Candidatus Micrarchaeota archaeon]